MTQPYQPNQGQPDFQQPGYQSQPGYQPQPGYQAQPGYQQPTYAAQQPQQPYMAQPMYATQAYAPLPKAPAKSPALGIISLILAVGGSALWGVPPYFINMVYGRFETSTTFGSEYMLQGNLMFAGGAALFVAFVLSIIAISINAGRVWGIVALVSSIILPWIVFFGAIWLNPTFPR